MTINSEPTSLVPIKDGPQIGGIAVVQYDKDGFGIVSEVLRQSLCEVGTSALACGCEYNLHRLAFFNFFRRAAALHASPQYLRRLVPMIAFLQLPQGRIFTHAR